MLTMLKPIFLLLVAAGLLYATQMLIYGQWATAGSSVSTLARALKWVGWVNHQQLAGTHRLYTSGGS